VVKLAQLKSQNALVQIQTHKKEQRIMWDPDTGTGTYKNYYADPDL
jgi:hypothetical protein